MGTLDCEWDSPVSALAQCVGPRLTLLGMVADPDGSRMTREGVEGKSTEPGEVGEAVAELLADAREREAPEWGIEADAPPMLGGLGMAGDLAALLNATGIKDLGDLEEAETSSPTPPDSPEEDEEDWDASTTEWRSPPKGRRHRRPGPMESEDYDDEEPL